VAIRALMTDEDLDIWAHLYPPGNFTARAKYYIADMADFSLMLFAQNRKNQRATYSDALLWIQFRGGN
jgi:hypothetical protein